MRLTKTTIFIGFFIVVSASFMRQVANFVKDYGGEKAFIISMGLLLVGGGLIFLFFIINRKIGLIRTLVVIMILIAGLTLAWQMKLVIERIHILEYGFLGWFASRDLIRRDRKIGNIILALMLIVTVGFLDEVFQAILPYRYWDVRDILFNGLGGAWGVILYLLS